jgi:serine/threonine-protein kinase RsbW
VRIESRLERLAEVREAALSEARAAGFAEDEAADLALCVHEAAMNAIEHGNRFDPQRHVTVRFRRRPEGLLVEVLDEGPGIPEDAIRPESRPPAETGRGLRIIASLMDEVELSPSSGRVRMFRRRRT